MYHIPILLFWDQDIATPPRTLPESDKRSYKLCQFIDTSRYLSFPHVMLLKLFPTEPYREYFHVIFQKLRLYWRRQKMKPNIRKIDILCNVTNKKFARHFENHRCMTWRHTGSDQWTNAYPTDGPSLLPQSNPFVLMAGTDFLKKKGLAFQDCLQL